MQLKGGGFNRTGSRTPMQWNRDKNAGFSKCDKDKLYLPIQEDGINVEEQLIDDSSLLTLMKKLIKLRKSSHALSNDGDIEFLNRKYNGYPLIYKRNGSDGEYLICINPLDKRQNFSFGLKNAKIIMENDEAKVTDNEITLEPMSYAIIKLHD